jgi:hypothetical protein
MVDRVVGKEGYSGYRRAPMRRTFNRWKCIGIEKAIRLL